jgi:lipopolysaccharide export system protein LptA
MKRISVLLTCSLLAVAALGQGATDDLVTSEITSDASIYDQKANTLHYWGKVHLSSPGTLDLRCDDFRIQLGAGGGKLDQIVASTNVVLLLVQPGTGGKPATTNVAYAHQAIFDGVRNLVTLAQSPTGGQPRFEGPELVAEADVIIYDRTRDRFELKGHHRTRFKPGKLSQGGFFSPKTNAVPVTR